VQAMSGEWALVRAALEEEDDAVRLVLADWCEECGPTPGLRARAEFVRLQVELARWVPDLDRRLALQAREQQILAAHATEWLGGRDAPWRSWHFERGGAWVRMLARRFVSRSFAHQGRELLRRAWVHTIRLERPESQLSSVAKSPLLEELIGLDLSKVRLSDESLRKLLSSPFLGRLRCLDLSNNLLTAECVADLTEASSRLASLVRLDLRNNQINEDGLESLLASPLARQLRLLEVQGNGLTSAGMGLFAEWQRPRLSTHPGDQPVRVHNSLGMAFNRIPPGIFWMGSPEEEPGRYDNEGPRHRVTLTRPFYLGVFPMTHQQFHELMALPRSDQTWSGSSRSDHPICDITWEEAQEVCQRLSALAPEQAAGRRYRLPTEAEWEYACRAGTLTPFYFGAMLSAEEANFNSAEPYGPVRPTPPVGGTTRVGSYPANPFGLYDLHGNVQEWCQDWFGPYTPEDQTDPTGLEQGETCLLRGGSWLVNGIRCRSARRNHYYPDSHHPNYGLRVVLELSPAR
jgi:uncharacterized protein (TIGR02996 family)